VDTGKRLDNDGSSSEVPWLEGSVLPAAPLPVVGVAHDNPRDTLGLVVPRGAWDVSVLPRQLVTNLIHGLIEGISGTVKIENISITAMVSPKRKKIMMKWIHNHLNKIVKLAKF
jgi:hypothetical protein